MPRRNGLGLELIQSLLDLCGIHLHRTTPLVWVSVCGRAFCGASHSEWSQLSASSVCSAFVNLRQLLARSSRRGGLWLREAVTRSANGGYAPRGPGGRGPVESRFVHCCAPVSPAAG